jgi:hypothetical protein
MVGRETPPSAYTASLIISPQLYKESLCTHPISLFVIPDAANSTLHHRRTMEEPSTGKDFKGNGDTIEPASSLPGYRPDTNTDAINATPVEPKKSFVTRVKHSFRRREDTIRLNALGQQVIDDDKVIPAGESGHDTSRLDRRLKGRHMQMIAIGGAIGTGLFIGSGSALATGGPAALMIGFGIVGLMLFCVIHALGELAVMFPIAGKSPIPPNILCFIVCFLLSVLC